MGHGDRYIGSLFRVDEPVPDDSLYLYRAILGLKLFAHLTITPITTLGLRCLKMALHLTLQSVV